MSIFSDAAERGKPGFQRAFADPVIYQQPLSDPFTLSAIRLDRSPDQLEQGGSFEGLFVYDSDFPLPPAIGDKVQMDGASYVVSDVRNPNPEELSKVIVLTRTVKSIPGQ